MTEYYVTVDVGGTKVLASIIGPDDKIIARHKVKTDRRSNKFMVEQIESAIDEVIKAVGANNAAIAGIAIGVPGIVESSAGYIVDTTNTPLSGTPLSVRLSNRYGDKKRKLPVFVGNDANLGVLGESVYGAARGASSAFGIFVGTGIGGGLVLNGQLVEGYRSLGGEIGHLMIPLGADEISGMLTRKHRFLEELCSRTAIENQLRHAILKEGQSSILTEIVTDKNFERIRSGALKQALKRKDPLTTDVMRRSSFLLGLAAASILHVVDPEVLVFGGGVIEACGNWMFPWIEKTIRKVALEGTGKPLKIVRSELGDDAILMGALALLKQHAAAEAKSAPEAVSNTASTPVKAAASSAKTSAQKVKAKRRAQVDKPLGRPKK